jgi:hypothetical protein
MSSMDRHMRPPRITQVFCKGWAPTAIQWWRDPVQSPSMSETQGAMMDMDKAISRSYAVVVLMHG